MLLALSHKLVFATQAHAQQLNLSTGPIEPAKIVMQAARPVPGKPMVTA